MRDDKFPAEAGTSARFNWVRQKLQDLEDRFDTDPKPSEAGEGSEFTELEVKLLRQLAERLATGGLEVALAAAAKVAGSLMPREELEEVQRLYGIQEPNASSQKAIVRHKSALGGFPSAEELHAKVRVLLKGRLYTKQMLMTAWVCDDAERAGWGYFAGKLGLLEYDNGSWKRTDKQID